MSENSDAEAQLGREIVKIILVQGLGYALKAASVMDQRIEAGIGAFVGQVAFPAVLFRALALMDLSTVNLVVAASSLIAKSFALAIAMFVGWAMSTGSEAVGMAEARGGMVALYGTMSDDVALGVPVFAVLFKEDRLINMLYLLSGMQSFVMNPCCYVIFALSNVRKHQAAIRDARKHQAEVVERQGLDSDAEMASDQSGHTTARRELILQVLRGVLLNPLFFSVLLGLAWNLFTRVIGADNSLPWFLGDMLELLATSFLPTTYFVAGMTMVGSFSSLNSLRYVEVPILMVTIKSLFLPFTAYVLVQLLGGSPDERDFAFEYGLMPTASSSLVILQRFALPDTLITAHNVALGIGRPVGFLLLFVYAAIATNEEDQELHLRTVSRWSTAMHAFSIAGLSCLLLLAAAVREYGQMLGRVVGLAFLMWMFAIAFVAIGKDRVDHITSPYTQTLAFCLVSTLRWSADTYVVYLCLDDQGLIDQLSSLGGLHRGLRRLVANVDERVFSAQSQMHEPLGDPMPICGREASAHSTTDSSSGVTRRHDLDQLCSARPIALAVCAGLFLTLPWGATTPWPDDDRVNVLNTTILPLWIPYVPKQASAYAFAYALLAALVGISLLTGLCRGMCSGDARIDDEQRHLSVGCPRRIESRSDGHVSLAGVARMEQRIGTEAAGNPAPHATASRSMPPLGVSHRLRLFSAVVLLRMIGESALSSALADPIPLAGVSFEQLYLLVFLHDGQGIIIFLLFGLHPRALQAFANVGVTLASVAAVLLAGLVAFLAHAQDAH